MSRRPDGIHSPVFSKAQDQDGFLEEEEEEEESDDSDGELWDGNEGREPEALDGLLDEDDLDDLEEESEEESDSLDEEELEIGSGQEDGGNPEVQDRDTILHWWCVRQLARSIRELRRAPKAGPFKEPLPWEELGLEDYLEVVEDPVDLRTIGERLNEEKYNDEDGLCDPEAFWADIGCCWQNCKLYYEEDMGVQAVQMAEDMRILAEGLEADFWADLGAFEASLDRVGGRALGKAAAVANVAKTAMKDAALHAKENAKNLVSKFRGFFRRNQVEEEEFDDRVLRLESVPRLRPFFLEILLMRYQIDANQDVRSIEEEVLGGLNEFFPHFEGDVYAHDMDDMIPNEALQFDGADKKLPLHRLLPMKRLAAATGRTKLRRVKAVEPFERPPSAASSNAPSRSGFNSARSSQFGKGSVGSRKSSLQGSSRQSSLSRSSRASSPSDELQRPSSNMYTPRSVRSDVSRGSASRGIARAVRRSVVEAASEAGVKVTEMRGVESSSESDELHASAPAVDQMRPMLPKRGSR
mmetsp:Transcript_78709/g.138864  ORF Transcript_78709/g.138864 Transcript_78709/m.138864 type:complete len:525 (+) Transcript_78709:80-1654(+)